MIAARLVSALACVGTSSRRTELLSRWAYSEIEMSGLRTRGVLALTGLYSASALFIAVATSESTPSSPPIAAHQPQSVDRLHKGDRMARSNAFPDGGSSIVVEVSGKSDVVVRDREGNILFAVDNATRATTVAKRSGRSAPALKENPPIDTELPVGCEGAFSSYAEPSKARIIGRCMSSISPRTEVLGSKNIVELSAPLSIFTEKPNDRHQNGRRAEHLSKTVWGEAMLGNTDKAERYWALMLKYHDLAEQAELPFLRNSYFKVAARYRMTAKEAFDSAGAHLTATPLPRCLAR
jgi:hypothetical protein